MRAKKASLVGGLLILVSCSPGSGDASENTRESANTGGAPVGGDTSVDGAASAGKEHVDSGGAGGGPPAACVGSAGSYGAGAGPVACNLVLPGRVVDRNEDLAGLGIPARDILPLSGHYTGTIEWTVKPDVAASVQPGSTRLTLDVALDPDMLTYYGPSGCIVLLKIGSRVSVATADGALNEDFDVALWSTTKGGVSGAVDGVAPLIKGTLKIVPKSPSFVIGFSYLNIGCSAPCSTCTGTCRGNLDAYSGAYDPCGKFTHPNEPSFRGVFEAVRPGVDAGPPDAETGDSSTSTEAASE